jgi:GTP-binding protein HflX
MDRVEPEYLALQLHRHEGVAISALSTQTLEPLILALQDRVEALMAEGWPSALTAPGEMGAEEEAEAEGAEEDENFEEADLSDPEDPADRGGPQLD